MRNVPRLTAAFLMICVLLTLMPGGYATNLPVKIILDGQDVPFASATPYYDDEAARIFVPVEALAEALGADCVHNEDDNTVTVTRGDSEIRLRLDVQTAQVNGVAVELDAAPFVQDGCAYVLLRFIADSLLLDISWNSETAVVTLLSRPILTLGMDASDARDAYGEPARTAVSEYGYVWWVYDDLDDYTLIGVADDIVVAYYRHSEKWQVDGGLRSGMAAVDCDAILSDRTPDDYGSYCLYTGTNSVYTLFYDEHDFVYAVLHELSIYAEHMRVTVAVLDGYARQFLDLVNVERRRAELPAIVWDERIADITREHSTAMARGVYSHIGSDGKSPTHRLESAGFHDFYQIEIIARAFPNALTAFCAHLNNQKYRAVLHASYTSMGAGVVFNRQSDGLLYYTQVFYTAK